MPITASANHTKIGTCPHGMPQGACPICNGISGGNSTTKRDIPRNAGEMTYNECAAIGAMLKAQKIARQRMENAQQQHLQAIIEFQKTLDNIHSKIINLTHILSNKTPAIIHYPLNFVLTHIVARIINIISSTPAFFTNLAQKFVDISDKLVAIFGELKSAIAKNLSKLLEKTKKKLKSLFFIFGIENSDNEEKKIDEVKKALNLKTFIQKFLHKKKEDKNAKD